jgi:Ca2+-transporting ATPase
MGHVLAVRSETRTLWSIGLFSNVPMLLSVLLTVALQLLILYVPWLNGVFKTQPLSAFEMAICIGLSAVVFFAVEGVKIITGKRREA